MTHILASRPGSWLDNHQHMMISSLDLHQHMMKLHFGILTWCSSTHDDIYHPESRYASTHDALFTWHPSTYDGSSLDLMINTWSSPLLEYHRHTMISSSWTWCTSTHDASFTSSSSLRDLNSNIINTWWFPLSRSLTWWQSTHDVIQSLQSHGTQPIHPTQGETLVPQYDYH